MVSSSPSKRFAAALLLGYLIIAHAATSPLPFDELNMHVLRGLGLSKIPDIRRGEHDGELHSTNRLNFSAVLPEDREAESGTLRLLVTGAERAEPVAQLEVAVYEEGGGRRPLATATLQPDYLPRWAELRLPPTKNAGRLRLQCTGCSLRLSRSVLNVLAVQKATRKKRENEHYRTDCYGSAKRQRCCRHKMQVVFKDLPGYEFIIQPFGFDAGFCKGSCPYRYNPANHHSSLQSLIWRQKKGAAPKPCCAPSKLDQLEILHLDEDDPTKLKLATWSNMKVTECACF